MSLYDDVVATRARSRALCLRSIALCTEVLSLTTPLSRDCPAQRAVALLCRAVGRGPHPPVPPWVARLDGPPQDLDVAGDDGLSERAFVVIIEALGQQRRQFAHEVIGLAVIEGGVIAPRLLPHLLQQQYQIVHEGVGHQRKETGPVWAVSWSLEAATAKTSGRIPEASALGGSNLMEIVEDERGDGGG